MNDSAFFNTGVGITFKGTLGTAAFNTCIFNNITTAIKVDVTAVFTRRFRVIYSSLVVLNGDIGIDFSTGATVPVESYILDTVNFGGDGTYITGVTFNDNKALFQNCTNIQNSFAASQLYMTENVTPTVIGNTTNYYKILGSSTQSVNTSKFTHSNNRLTYVGKLKRKFKITCFLSFNSGANNVVFFGFFDSSINAVRLPSRLPSTANSGGRAENVAIQCIVELNENDYIEIWTRNSSSTTSVTVDNLNFIID